MQHEFTIVAFFYLPGKKKKKKENAEDLQYPRKRMSGKHA